MSEIRFFQRLLPKESLCFDVGADIGEKSEALLKAGARVVAFEPNPVVWPELRARCGSNRNWTLVPTALGSAAAVTTLHSRKASGQSSLIKHWEGFTVDTYPVPVVTLDAAIRQFGLPSYCKIDVEGWELEVLKGLSQPIPLLSFEFHLSGDDVAKTRGCLSRLAEFGPAQVNITPAETPAFHWHEWKPLESSPEWFPGDLQQTLPGLAYGDIFVRA